MENRPEIGGQQVEEIRRIMQENPDWNRTQISKRICEIWGWRSGAGQIKDISCRDMLRDLERKGQIQLPPSKRKNPATKKRAIKHLEHDTKLIECALGCVLPLTISVAGKDDLPEFESLLDTYHYLGYHRAGGENMGYMAKSRGGETLACLLFGASAWKCADRDEYIGWDARTREKMLPMTANNTRFLILPWVRIPHLASHILSRTSKRVSGDWQLKYGHGLASLETFVEQNRFRGTAYKAANWQLVGETTGRGRNDRQNRATLPKKDIYIYPLVRRFREKLRKGERV